ncbi:MAG: hypothetical protein IPN36_15050 [Bacteroidetes bacterium]|nr:hypothetical protein [Bacteroidota bacterium]
MTKTITLLFLLLTFPAYTQSRISAFFKLSGPEKCWTLTHLFKSGRAHRITAYGK